MGVWIGTHDYDTQDIPVSVGASYYIMNDPEVIWQDYQSILDPGSREITPVGEDSIKYAFDYLGEKDYSLTLSCEAFKSESALTAYLDDAGFQPELELNQNEFIYMSQSDRNKFCYFDSSCLLYTSESTLTPQGEATRAQVAVMLERFCEQYQ